jgi:hypothetical protein
MPQIIEVVVSPTGHPQNKLNVGEHVMSLPPTLLPALDERHSLITLWLRRINADQLRLVLRSEIDDDLAKCLHHQHAALASTWTETDRRSPKRMTGIAGARGERRNSCKGERAIVLTAATG